ncbi:MAG: integrase arm-type DNA-binding domain-containing protein [Steroidobacteraceae bacterium]
MTALTEAAIRAAKPRQKAYKLTDGRGLLLLIDPRGGRYWRLRYRHEGTEKMLSLGTYPDVSLKAARERRETARQLIADGTDPSAQRQREKLARADTLAALAEEFFHQQEKRLDPSTLARDRLRMDRFVLPTLGKRPVAAITAPDLLACLRRIEARGRIETAHRTRNVFSRIARYAIATGRAERDVSQDLRGAIAAATVRNFASITDPVKIGPLLRALDGYVGQPSTHAALRLAPLTFVRPGELRAAAWNEFDLDCKEPVWRVPAERMKMREEHLVPLSIQAVAILKELQPLTGGGALVFPSLRSRTRPLSNNTINASLRRLGYAKDEMTGHGFRSMASTLLNEQGFPPDVIELQLAHKERSSVRAAYNRATRLGERRKMMQAWADYLDGLKASNNVVTLKTRSVAGAAPP